MVLLAFLLLALSPPLGARLSDTLPGYCAGGRMTFFERGSDRVEGPAVPMLDSFARYSLAQRANSVILIESGGDGTLSGFNPRLSRRRSEAIRDFLVAHGMSRRRIRIAVQENYGVRPLAGTDMDEFAARIGHVEERVTGEEYRRLYPQPGTIVECF